jgi:hypothetical protein
MRIRKLLAGLGVAISLAAIPLFAPEASAADGCSSPASYGGNAFTVQTTTLYGRNIELRYENTFSPHCGWGRITNGSPGDSVWVNQWVNGVWTDKSGAGGKAYIPSGGTQAYTPQAFNDGFGYRMTACGKAVNRTEVYCTNYY